MTRLWDPSNGIDLGKYVIVGNRQEMPDYGKSSGSNQYATYRLRYTTTRAGQVTAFRLVYCNTYLNTTGEEDGEANLLIKAAIEDGTIYKRVFFRGARTVTIEPGGFAISDPVGFIVNANTPFWVRTYVGVPVLGQKWATSTPMDFANRGEGFAASDVCDAVGSAGMSGAAGVGPSAILGVVGAANPGTAVIIGSSSAWGQGDTAETPYWDLGYLARSLSNKVGVVKITRPSQTTAQCITDFSRRFAHIAAINPDVVVWQMGSNDITNGTAPATMQANLLTLWNQLVRMGCRVYGTTWTPVTTSTDSWATLANQTQNANNANRVTMNNWMRTCPSPLSGFVEIADCVESARDSGLWKVNGTASKWTADGQHLSQYGHQTVGALFGPSDFGL